MGPNLEILPPKKVKVMTVAGKGLGVFATTDIKTDEVIEIIPIVFLSAKDSNYVAKESDLLKFYYLDLENYQKYCLMLGYGSIYNHNAKNPNADIFYPEPEDSTDRHLTMKAIRDIQAGEEITFDYEFDNNQEEFLAA